MSTTREKEGDDDEQAEAEDEFIEAIDAKWSGGAGWQKPNFLWEPAGLNHKEVVAFFKDLPNSDVPLRSRKDGDMRFRLKVESQMPQHDFDTDLCHELSPAEEEEFSAVVEMKNEAYRLGEASKLTSGIQCYGCSRDIAAGDIAVAIKHRNQTFHRACFNCHTCKELFVGLLAFEYDDKLYCARHFNDNLKPRCAACDETIMEESFTRAEGKCWHLKHFCCNDCDVSLAGQRYVPIDGMPYCINCWKLRTAPAQSPGHAAPEYSAAAAGTASYVDENEPGWKTRMSKEDCEAILLRSGMPGAFSVRFDQKSPSGLVLSVLQNGNVEHMNILLAKNGWLHLNNCRDQFESVEELVQFYCGDTMYSYGDSTALKGPLVVVPLATVGSPGVESHMGPVPVNTTHDQRDAVVRFEGVIGNLSIHMNTKNSSGYTMSLENADSNQHFTVMKTAESWLHLTGADEMFPSVKELAAFYAISSSNSPSVVNILSGQKKNYTMSVASARDAFSDIAESTPEAYVVDGSCGDVLLIQPNVHSPSDFMLSICRGEGHGIFNTMILKDNSGQLYIDRDGERFGTVSELVKSFAASCNNTQILAGIAFQRSIKPTDSHAPTSVVGGRPKGSLRGRPPPSDTPPTVEYTTGGRPKGSLRGKPPPSEAPPDSVKANELCMASVYPSIALSRVEALLKSNGSFLVRRSNNTPGVFAVTLRPLNGGEILHKKLPVLTITEPLNPERKISEEEIRVALDFADAHGCARGLVAYRNRSPIEMTVVAADTVTYSGEKGEHEYVLANYGHKAGGSGIGGAPKGSLRGRPPPSKVPHVADDGLAVATTHPALEPARVDSLLAEPGSFLVRKSKKTAGAFTVSLRPAEGGALHHKTLTVPFGDESKLKRNISDAEMAAARSFAAAHGCEFGLVAAIVHAPSTSKSVNFAELPDDGLPAPHIPDTSTYEVLWPAGDPRSDIRRATVVASQFAGSFRRDRSVRSAVANGSRDADKPPADIATIDLN